MVDKLVSVVIPAYNEKKSIASCLKSVMSQKYRPLEVIVIDDSSTDGTGEVAAGFRGVEVIRHQKNEGLAASLNDGIKRAKGRLVMALHADCELVGRDWVTKAVKHFSRDRRIAVVSGRPEFSRSYRFVDRAFAILRLQFFDENKEGLEDIPFFEDKCDVYRKPAIMNSGGFPSSRFRISGEDQIVSYSLRQVGYRIVRDNSLAFIQRHGQAASTFFRNLEREYVYGKTQAGIWMKFGGFQLKGTGRMGFRVLYRMSKLVFSALFVMLVCVPFLKGLLIPLVFLRYLFFLWIPGKTPSVTLNAIELLALPLVGILTDFVYSAGFVAGLFLYAMGRRL